MMLTARSIGIGSVWLSFPDSVEIKWHFNIPKTMGVAAMLNFGYPDKWPDIPDVIGADDPRFWPRRPVENTVHYEKFDEEKWQKDTRGIFMYGPVVGKDKYLELEAKNNLFSFSATGRYAKYTRSTTIWVFITIWPAAIII